MSKGGIMKNKKNQEKQKAATSRNNFGQRVWRIAAIAVVVVFAVLMVGGLIKAHYIRSSFAKPTQAQIDYATKIATEKLKSSGGNSSMFQIRVGSRMRRLHEDGANRTIIQVSFNNNVASHTYLIDVNTGEVLLHSETDTYIAFGEHKKKRYHDDREFFEHDKIK